MSKCVSPVFVQRYQKSFPCGKCYYCKAQRRAEWCFRLSFESYHSKHTSFITFTYDDENLPFLDNGSPTLFPDHLSKLIKDLRNSGYKFKYYCVGEYGGKFGRPHYHGIFFSEDDIYFSHFWHRGSVKEESPRSMAALHYIGKYHIVPKTRAQDINQPKQPFSRMSKRLGAAYVDQYINKNTGEIEDVPFTISFNNYRYPLPRYYRKKLMMPSDQDFTYYIDYIEKKYPNLPYSQKLHMFSQAIENSNNQLKKYSNQVLLQL